MRRLSAVIVAVTILFLLVSHSGISAREPVRPETHIWRYWSPDQYAGHLSEIDPGLREMYSSTAIDTYTLIYYDFEDMDWQGWTQVDNTWQHDTYFHADDFDGLGGGDYGRLVPIEGTKSIWCGARSGTDPYMCGWYYAPGYGNNWDQWFRTDDILVSGTVHFSFHGIFDSETDYDYTYVEWARDYGDWVELDAWCGTVDTIVAYEINPTKAKTKFRFHFTSDGAWSDQDGRGNTDGACIIDQISISDNTGLLDYEDFEDWDVGATDNLVGGDWWRAYREGPYGSYSGLWSGLEDKDPCYNSFGTQIVFFIGSPDPSEDYPGLYETPYCYEYTGGIKCQDEMVVSPVIDLTKYSTGKNEVQDADIPAEVLPGLGGTILRFTLYGDTPGVAPDRFVRNIDETGCPGPWHMINQWVYGGPTYNEGLYYFVIDEMGRWIEEDRIQVGLGCIDYCIYEEYPEYCGDHGPTPWYDNVRVERYTQVGPQWVYRALDLFQDNFPEDEFDIESFVRADAADDKASGTDPFFIPGDSVVVTCTSPLGGGIREGGVSGGGEVYLHARCTDISEWLGKPNLYGPSLEGTYGTYAATAGEWTIIQCDTAKAQFINPVPDQWSVDLNDTLLTRGYMVEYYFSAVDVSGDVTTLPDGGGGSGAGASLTSGPSKVYEFTCLPTGLSDILYVDDFDGRGCHEGVVQIYFDRTFEKVLDIDDELLPDRYDVNSPSSMVGNGLASRATLNQLLYDDVERSGYTIIIWDSGDLDVGTIGDGNPTYEKTDDCSQLINWLDQSEHDVGLWISGDMIAYDLSENLGSVPAIQLMSTWCGVNHVNGSYFDMMGGVEGGGVVNPLVTGSNTGIYWNGGDPWQLYLDGACPIFGNFDVISTTANGVEALMYPDFDADPCVAGIQSAQQNAMGYTARTMWLGFSFMHIRNAEFSSPLVRDVLMAEFIQWCGHPVSPDIIPGDPTGDEVPKAYRLCQNFPNPFNPTTAIRFDIKKKGQVSLRIYNVAGQLVRTLVDGELEARSYTKEWKGLNNDGSKVASGVYFYRLEAGEFESVKKMVLLR